MNKSVSIAPRIIIRLVIVTGVLLLVPLVAMRLSDNVHWTAFDFVAAAVVLLAAGLACELTLAYVRSTKRRVIALATILALLALVWVELAVGLFGTPFAGN